MEIKRSGSQPSIKGPEPYFTGAVRIDPLFELDDNRRIARRNDAEIGHAPLRWSGGGRPDAPSACSSR